MATESATIEAEPAASLSDGITALGESVVIAAGTMLADPTERGLRRFLRSLYMLLSEAERELVNCFLTASIARPQKEEPQESGEPGEPGEVCR